MKRILLIAMLLLSSAAAGPAVAGEALQSAGDAVALILPATAGVSTLFLNDREGTIQLVESTAVALGVTMGLKYTVNERRPNGEDQSFPSGHSAISFSASEFIRKRYGWEYGVPAYLAASFVGYSRIESKQHYFHDVAAGAAIGIGSSYLFTSSFKKVAISSEAGPGYYGVRLSGNW